MLLPIGFFASVDPEILRRHVTLIKDALRNADIASTKAALWQDIDHRQFARQLDGEGHLSYTRMVKLPLKYWQWFFFLGSVMVGLPKEVRRSARLHIATSVFKRHMAKMTTETLDDERKRA